MKLFYPYLIAFSLSLTAGCSSRGSKLSPVTSDASSSRNQVYATRLEWQTPLKSGTAVTARFTFTDKTGVAAQSVESFTVKPWMPSMGHGTYTGDQKIALVAGTTNVYDVSGIYFTMGGTWELQISATVNGQGDSANISVEVP
jgi:YtkA-like